MCRPFFAKSFSGDQSGTWQHGVVTRQSNLHRHKVNVNSSSLSTTKEEEEGFRCGLIRPRILENNPA